MVHMNQKNSLDFIFPGAVADIIICTWASLLLSGTSTVILKHFLLPDGSTLTEGINVQGKQMLKVKGCLELRRMSSESHSSVVENFSVHIFSSVVAPKSIIKEAKRKTLCIWGLCLKKGSRLTCISFQLF